MVQEFAFIGVENLLIKDKKTKEVECELPYLVGFNLSDNQPIEYLRGGLERLKLLPFKGDRETSVTVTTATSSPDLLRLQLGTEFEEVETEINKIENITSDNGSFVLKETPATGTVVTVWAVDESGRKAKLVKGDVAEAGKFAISDKTISCEEAVKSIRVSYVVKEIVTSMSAKDVDTKVWEISGMIVAQEVGTGALYSVQCDIPSAVIQLNTQLDASNEGGVPDNIEFTIDMLADATKDFVYKLSFREKL